VRPYGEVSDRRELSSIMGEVISLGELLEAREKWKGKKVVFTNGCFDLLHIGHIHCLREAKKWGEILIVGLNSDSSVRKIKGEERPIVPQRERAAILASLEMVDYVCIFDEDTPYRIISLLKPDCIVKGGDWRPEDVVGKDMVEGRGGRVVTVNIVEEKSTKGLIQKIIERYCPEPDKNPKSFLDR